MLQETHEAPMRDDQTTMGPALGVEPWLVSGANKTDALRTAVHELGDRSPREEP
jgi:hypothetical protein